MVSHYIVYNLGDKVSLLKSDQKKGYESFHSL
jgi:hypothetical protein